MIYTHYTSSNIKITINLVGIKCVGSLLCVRMVHTWYARYCNSFLLSALVPAVAKLVHRL